MKRLLIVVALACSPQAWAGTVKFAWDAPIGVPVADIAGYNFYLARVSGTNVGPYVKVNSALIASLPTPAVPYSVQVPDNGWRYNAYATCVGTSGKESGPSNVVPFDAEMAPPSNNRVVP